MQSCAYQVCPCLVHPANLSGMHIKSREEPVVINAYLSCSLGRTNDTGI
jgi:hypothetical protein